MLNILFYILISFMLIYMIHQMYLMLKETLTTPKIIDLSNESKKEYRKMYHTLHPKSESHKEMDKIYEKDSNSKLSTIEHDANKQKAEQKEDLKSFFNQLTKTNPNVNIEKNVESIRDDLASFPKPVETQKNEISQNTSTPGVSIEHVSSLHDESTASFSFNNVNGLQYENLN